MSASLQSQAESDIIIAFCLCLARASVSLKRLCWNKNLHCISKKSHLWLAIILTYTIRLQKFLAEVLQRKQEIRRCFVFPPHISSASALSCEIGNPEDGALVHCACNTLSNFCSALDFVYPEPCFQKPRSERIDYKIYGVIQQREYESWVKKRLKKSSSWLNSGNALIQHLSEKCNLRVCPFCQVMQKDKLFQ